MQAAMSRQELRRVEVLVRAAKGTPRLPRRDAAELLQLRYRQAKRLWRRYKEKGAESLQHGNARATPQSAPSPRACGRFGSTLAAEHLALEDGLPMDAAALPRHARQSPRVRRCGWLAGSALPRRALGV